MEIAIDGHRLLLLLIHDNAYWILYTMFRIHQRCNIGHILLKLARGL